MRRLLKTTLPNMSSLVRWKKTNEEKLLDLQNERENLTQTTNQKRQEYEKKKDVDDALLEAIAIEWKYAAYRTYDAAMKVNDHIQKHNLGDEQQEHIAEENVNIAAKEAVTATRVAGNYGWKTYVEPGAWLMGLATRLRQTTDVGGRRSGWRLWRRRRRRGRRRRRRRINEEKDDDGDAQTDGDG